MIIRIAIVGVPLLFNLACGKKASIDLAGEFVAASSIPTPAPAATAALPSGPAPSLDYAAPHFPFGAYNTNAGCTVANTCSDGDPNDFNDPDNTMAFAYPTFTFYVDLPVSITPSNVGTAITNCTISPDLPSGLSFSAADCSITGTPTVTSGYKFYTVSAYGSEGWSQTLLAASVGAASVKVINIPQQRYVLTQGQAITPIVPQMGGAAAVADCTKNGGLPAGLSYAAGTCNITGTPTTAGSTSYAFAVSAGTTTQENFVVPPAPGYWSGLGTSVLIWFYVVDPANQPLVSYGSQYFGKADLTVGTEMISITPLNLGAAITSCAVIPTLPDGLSLSQTDCTVSGTPTTFSNPTTYLIIPKSGSKTGNGLSLDLSVSNSPSKSLACQSSTLCVHGLMPVWSQTDKALANYLSSQGYNVGSPPTDQGWCGGVSSAMLLKTYFQEIGLYSNAQSTAWPSPFTANDTEYPFILKSMQVVATDIVHGGTGFPNSGFNSFLGFCGYFDDHFGGGAPSIYTDPSQYSHGMPLGWLAVHGPGGSAPHALVINGVEGNYFKVFDPWGAVYNATVTYDANGTNGALTFIDGTQFNEIDYYDSGVATVSIQWVKDYANVSGASAPYRCQ